VFDVFWEISDAVAVEQVLLQGVPGGEGGEFSHGLSSLERTQIIKG